MIDVSVAVLNISFFNRQIVAQNQPYKVSEWRDRITRQLYWTFERKREEKKQ